MLEKFQLDKPKGLTLLFDGNVPAGGGLSSSAAMVCASALAVITANQLTISKTELTEIAIVAERNVGVNSGGMDQSASVLSEKDFALHVEFVPKLHTSRVPLPKTTPPLAFVISNTLVVADKFVSGPRNYNLRVVETRMAAIFLAKKLGLAPVDSLKEVFDLYYKDSSLSEEERFSDLLKKALELYPQDNTGGNGYTLEEVCEMIDYPVDDFKQKYMTRFPVETDYFRLVHRTKHVLSEASRVVEFHNVCEEQSQSGSALKTLGDLMNASQESCDKQFMCSCPEINEVCEIARKAGSFGSRLTGAGWGGCTVHLTTEDNVANLIKAIKEEYYNKKFPELSEDQVDDAIVVTKPCSGAAIFTGF
jgi:galactokinase